MNKAIQFTITVQLLGLITTILLAKGPGTSGGRTLLQSIGARPAGMGEAFVAVSDDANSIYYNPAGLTRIKTKEITTMYLRGLVDENYLFLGYAGSIKIPFLGTTYFGPGLLYYDGGRIELNYLDGTSEVRRAQEDFVLNFCCGRKIIKTLSCGINAKFILSRLVQKYTALGVGLDLGLLYNTPIKGVTAGFVIQNIGTRLIYKTEGVPLQMNIKFGLAYERCFKFGTLIAAADLVKPDENTLRQNIGVEFLYRNMFAVRAGYKFGYDLDRLTLGFGLKYKIFTLDYAFSLMTRLNPAHRISLTCKFGK